MSRRRIVWGVVANLYDRVIVTVCQLALVPVLAHVWGVHLYGCWVVLATVPGFLALADLGLGSAAYFRMTTLIARGEREEAQVVLHTVCRLVASACVVVLAGALVGSWLVPAGWLPTDPALSPNGARAVLALLAGYAIAILQSGLQTAVFRSAGLFPLGTFASTHIYLFETALVAVAALSGHGPVLAAAGLLAGRLTGVVAQWALLRWKVRWMRFGTRLADRAEGRTLISPALTMLAIPLGQAAVLQGSVIALGAAAGPAATPAFAAARTLARLGLQPTLLVTHAVMAEFTAAAARNDRLAQARLLLTVAGTAAVFALPVALGIGIAGPWAMALWTKGAIVPSAGLMPVMAGVVLLGGAWQPLSTMMLAINRQGVFSPPYLWLGMGGLLLTYLLSLRFGATGAAAAMVALDACMCLVVGRFVVQNWLRGLPLAEVARTALGQVRGAVAR